MAVRRQLDRELIRRKLVSTREEAQQLIIERRVVVSGVIADNPSRLVTPAESVAVNAPPAQFVSRAGEKLEAALQKFEVDVSDRRVIDVGASTGGFTDCVLQRGAREVLAIDVGTNQLDHRLRGHDRVTVWEQTNIRSVDPHDVEPADVLVADLSFISLKKVLDIFAQLLAPDGVCLTLVKPQFEVTHDEASTFNGVIRSSALWRRSIEEVVQVAQDLKLDCTNIMASPITGASGNVEFFIMLQPAGDARDDSKSDDDRRSRQIDEAIASVVVTDRYSESPDGEHSS